MKTLGAREAKYTLEQEVLRLFVEFERNTALYIADVSVNRVDWTGFGDKFTGSQITSVKIDVRL